MNAVKRLFESLHHGQDDFLVIVLFNAGEIEIGREPSLRAEEHFPKACTSFERQSVQNSALRQQLQQEGQHHLFLRDHDVAQPGFIRIALHLGLGQHL